jgi:hypothetical protein
MVTNLYNGDKTPVGASVTLTVLAIRGTLICKRLAELPPVVSDWQQSCQQPRCPHYRRGACGNPRRQGASAACPFDGKELQLVDADASVEDGPSWGVQGVQKKQQTPAADEMRR